MKHPLRSILLALIPLGLGLGIYAVWQIWLSSMPLLVFKADAGSALAVVGLVISLLLLSWVLGGWAAALRCEQRLTDAHQSAEAARRRFIRQLDHALKNPLTGLRAAMANLGMGGPEAGSLGDADRQVERLSRLVGDLRKLAEMEERPIESDAVDLATVLEETVEALRELPQHAGRSITLVISKVPWPLPAVTGDRDLLGLAFYNLVENALKYSGPGDAVEVRAVEDGRWLIVEVADSGPGIAGEDLPRVFEELYRGANARGLEGSGLGLALVRRVIERHAGEVTVRSRQSGQKGTVFRVRMPARRG